jgi:prolyl-tRNA editing enzyme YbaK/EbsC (Cys-tRNA(Pro) deacylase)
MDEDLMRCDEVWAAAGRPDSVFPVHPRLLAIATGATVCSLAAAPS